MNWQTIVISLFGSTVIAAVVAGWMNHRTQIQAIKESGLYTKRAEVLDELMTRMARLHRLTGELISPIQQRGDEKSERERGKKSLQAYEKLKGYFEDHRHYLNEQLCADIEEVLTAYADVIIDFATDVKENGKTSNREKWSEVLGRYSNELKKKHGEVAKEFRKIIGVK